MGRQRGKVHNIGEQYGDIVKPLRQGTLQLLQFVDDSFRQNVEQQLFRLLLLKA